MGTLFEQIAKEHSVPVERVYSSLGHNRAQIDLAVNLPFALLYCFAAAAVARMIWRRYPPAEEGWIPGAIMTLFVSLAFALGGTMLGQMWSWTAETYRIGNAHMSYRAYRLLWARHPAALFGGALVVFWLSVTKVVRGMRSNYSL
jgi:hypothetical protein